MSTYTPEMVSKIRDAAPIDLEKAKALAEELGVSYRSVIAKAKTEKIEYVKASPASKKPRGKTKADLVREIESAMGFREEDFTGLDKAPAGVLAKLLTFAERANDNAESVNDNVSATS